MPGGENSAKHSEVSRVVWKPQISPVSFLTSFSSLFFWGGGVVGVGGVSEWAGDECLKRPN